MKFYSVIQTKLFKKCFVALLITLFVSSGVAGQFKDTTLYVQYPAKGYVRLNNGERVAIRGIKFYNGDSVILFQKVKQSSGGTRVYNKMTRLNKVAPRLEAISSMTLLKENAHAFAKGAVAGALVGFCLGYAAGYISYADKPTLNEEDNDDKRKNKAGLYGVIGVVPFGMTGSLLSGVVLRKRFTINGSKEKLITTLEKIY